MTARRDRNRDDRRNAGACAQAVLTALLPVLAAGCYHAFAPLPPGACFRGPERAAAQLSFLGDVTYLDPSGKRVCDQEIFDTALAMIKGARRLVLLDVFLYNDFGVNEAEVLRPLTEELTEALVRQKRDYPDLQAVVVTDPLNTFYGGWIPEHIRRLEEAGVEIVVTDLQRLRDSNPFYSTIWRLTPTSTICLP